MQPAPQQAARPLGQRIRDDDERRVESRADVGPVGGPRGHDLEPARDVEEERDDDADVGVAAEVDAFRLGCELGLAAEEAYRGRGGFVGRAARGECAGWEVEVFVQVAEEDADCGG